MYRHLLSFLVFLALQSPAHLFSVERTDIILRKNTAVLLTKVLSPVKRQGFLVFDLNRVHLDEGAKLYLDAPAEIHARSIELRPGSAILTLGNPIRIHTEVFIPGDMNEDLWSFDYIKKISQMGSIDTRHRDKHDGADNPAGLSGRRGGDAGRDAGARAMGSIPLAGKGMDGEHGENGQHGRSSGAITLNVKLFQGGYFVAPGGEGGDGGLGGNGGDGGMGYIDLRNNQDYSRGDAANFSFLDAGPGGSGGAGGHGGDGGYGGRITIRYEVMSAHALEAFFYMNSGGAAGLGGSGGLPGRSGLPGMVAIGGGNPDWRDGSAHVGKPGADGQMGTKGENGKKGLDGGTPGMERRQYETSR